VSAVAATSPCYRAAESNLKLDVTFNGAIRLETYRTSDRAIGLI